MSLSLSVSLVVPIQWEAILGAVHNRGQILRIFPNLISNFTSQWTTGQMTNHQTNYSALKDDTQKRIEKEGHS